MSEVENEVEDTVDQLALIKEDVEKLLKRSQNKNVGFDMRAEFRDNTYPVLLDLIDALKSRFDDVEGVLAEYLEPTESLVMPDFADRLAKLLVVGGRLAVVAKVLSDALGGNYDDVTAQKVAEQLDGGVLDQWVAGYVQEAQNAINELSTVTFDDGEDEDEDEEDVEDEDDLEDEEEEEVEGSTNG